MTGGYDIHIERAPDRSGFRLTTELLVRQPLEDVFDFFADAFNLEMITPPWLQFRVTTPAPVRMVEGANIDYRLRLHAIPIRWQSRISVWEPPYRFVDEQVHGPYRWWHHDHGFETRGPHTCVRDVVHYAVPLSCLIHPLLVRGDLMKIFRYRSDRLCERFDCG